ncbi:MAG: hypothetical protein AEth_01514 [Candidatus Argoarchaeum ethanivorans]|uniref:TIR domain-containing protein n=1 Tax=Candidatus Argoarchaeum ethanivorans TaxID=2608793 RepID=A0A8B3S177_9EURY|nr:MAG: hypothetical protein AEth_01514 [Candidatus Argoarchaeum ethanivorans]
MKNEKPVIFVSHAATDKPIAEILKAEIDRVFANGVHVFASSVPGVMKPGSDWLNSVKENLDKAKAVVVLMTPVSINRPWIWFEVGASWSKMTEGKGRIYPLCAPEIEFSELPEPLSRLQALSLGKAEHIKLFFQTLCDQFGFGNMKGFKGSAIKSRLPKYTELKLDSKDLDTGTIYTGPYGVYSSDELKEVLDEEYLYNEHHNYTKYSTLYKDRDSSVFMGKLVHYQKLDERLELPQGTAKKYLKEVAKRYDLEPYQEWENSIRFASRE